MFLGFDDSLKGLKKEFKDAGVDMSIIRQWQKSYDKVRQHAPVLEGQYKTAKLELETVLAWLKDMEQQIIDGRINKDSLGLFCKEMKKFQGHFNQEFLIGKADTDFQTTYLSIIKLCDKGIGDKGNLLILQSEIENLMAVTKEALEKAWPGFKELAFFYLEHTDKEISDMPHLEKVARINGIYGEQFVAPFLGAVTGRINQERIAEIMEEELWS